jgi:hypothetical protein
MDERDLAAEDAPPRPLVDEGGPFGRQTGELEPDVVDLEGDVMHAGTALGEKLPDRSIRPVRGEQLASAVADPEERDVGSLLVNRFAQLDLGSEEPPIRLDRVLEIVDRDADVMEAAYRHPGDATPRR